MSISPKKNTFARFMTSLALMLALPALASVAVAAPAKTKAEKSAEGTSATGSSTAGMSKEEADKVKEHTKLRGQIAKVKYPASKADVVAKVKGLKADDKKWFEQTLPEKSYSSADDVYQALGWPTSTETAGGGAGAGSAGTAAAGPK